MALEYATAFCKTCEAQRKVERKAPSHLMHLLITIVLGAFTMGVGAVIWLIVWILVSIRFGGWRCSTCGDTKIQMKPNYLKIGIYGILGIIVSIGVSQAIVEKGKRRAPASTSKIQQKETKDAQPGIEDDEWWQIRNLAHTTRKEFLEEFNAEEDKVADIMLKDGILYLGLLDDDFNRRGFAEYTCVTLLERNNDTIFGNDANIAE